MIIKKTFFTLLVYFYYQQIHTQQVQIALAKVKSDYDKAVTIIKAAKKYEKKGKLDKANKRYEKAQALLIKSNKKKPLQADTLNYLGFTTRKLGDYENGEKYYLLGLEIESKSCWY